MDITLNNEQKLFVINSGNSYSCLGFDVVFAQACELATRLLAAGRQIILPNKGEVGTLSQYEHYKALLADYVKLNDSKTWFDGRTPYGVQKAIERCRKNEHKVRIFCGDTKTGRVWLDEHDTIGFIGRSMGPMKVPLLFGMGDIGGPALLTQCVLRIVDLEEEEDVYRNKKFYVPEMAVAEAPDYEKIQGFTHSVLAEGTSGEMEPHANFKSYAEAAHWLAFMAGQTHVPPVRK